MHRNEEKICFLLLGMLIQQSWGGKAGGDSLGNNFGHCWCHFCGYLESVPEIPS